MKGRVFFFVALVATGVLVAAQDAGSVLLTYQRNFVRSSLATKLELLKEAGQAGKASDIAPLYDTALRFVLDNAGLLQGDAQLRDLALLAVKKAGESGYAKAAADVWSVFAVYAGDAELRSAAIDAYARTGLADPKTAADIGGFLSSQLSIYRSGMQPELPTVEAAIGALGLIGDPVAYPVLFAAYVAAPTPVVKTKAADAMTKQKGDLGAWLRDVVAKNPPLERIAALELGLGAGLSDNDRGALAEAALNAALDWSGDSPVEQAAMYRVRVTADKVIGDLMWQRAAPAAIKHFRLLWSSWQDGSGSKDDLVSAIATLGAMGSSDAAQALALNLQLINAQTEQGKPWDEDILLAVISALGRLGDKVAFDYLLYIGYLQYPDSVKTAAKEALQELKW